ncbi:MAG: hypothetical protein ACR2NT_08670 [Acidimicrobiia bacterium]|nr:hypothetical protein [Actinomycetota bacterium]
MNRAHIARPRCIAGLLLEELLVDGVGWRVRAGAHDHYLPGIGRDLFEDWSDISLRRCCG